MGGSSGGGHWGHTPAPFGAAAKLPEAINALKLTVLEQAALDDHSGQEVVSLLTLAWVAATRWRIEQSMDLDAPD